MSNTQNFQQKMLEIKMMLNAGADYAECKKLAEPLIASMNEIGERRAKQFGVKHKKITFGSIMR